MFGTLQEFGRSKAGNPKLKIDGRWYPAGRNNLDGLTPGCQVEFEAGSFPGSDGKPVPCINKIRPANEGAAMRPAPRNGAQGGLPIVVPATAPVDEASLRFISNVVGSALTGGQIKSPTDVKGWTLAALEALRALSEPAGKDVDPELDDDLPDSFYDNLPPPKKVTEPSW